MSKGIPTPESDRLKVARPTINQIKNFIDFLESKNIHLCERESNCRGTMIREPNYHRTMKSRDDLVFEFFDIDKQKVEDERQAVLGFFIDHPVLP